MKKQALLTTAIVMTLFTTVGAFAHEGFDKANGPKPMPPKGQMAKPHNPEVMKQRMAEFEQKLNLTEDQKAQIKKNHEKSRAKMEKLMQQEKKLREEKRKIMEENKKAFEAILTDEQKETLKQMHEEKMKAWKEKQEKEQNGKGKVDKPQPIKPKKVTK